MCQHARSGWSNEKGPLPTSAGTHTSTTVAHQPRRVSDPQFEISSEDARISNMDLLLPGILMWMVVATARANGKLISCICTTTHCQEQQTSRCNTTSMCFSQYLDRRDGSNPVIRGCITSKTPLLCENRRPAVALGNWPVLVCCNTNMCNQDVMPTPPVLDGRGTIGNTGESGLSPISTTAADTGMGDRGGEGRTNDDATSDIPRASNFFNSIYIIVLVIGVCCLVVIGVIAVMVLRRQSHLYDDEFGDVERHGYLKGHHPVPRQDPDPQVNLPKVNNGTYDNKAVFNT